MKNFLIICAFLISCQANIFGQRIEFETLEVNYGEIAKGSNGVRELKFKNTGDAPLTIENAQGSCGCVVPDYPREPIMPGETKSIRVKYDTQRVGFFTKYVTITTNATNYTTLRITVRGNVQPEPDPTPIKEVVRLRDN